MKPGTQIIYVPFHAEGNENHEDAEQGFITSLVGESQAFCRFWSKHSPKELRTKANSEKCDIEDLIEKDTHDQEEIDRMLPQL